MRKDYDGADHLEGIKAVNDALVAFERLVSLYEERGDQDRLTAANVVQFALIWNADVRSLLDDLDQLRGQTDPAAEWKRQLAARFIAVTIYEAADDFTHLLGKDFRGAALRLRLDPRVGLNDLHGELRSFRNSEQRWLSEIRNTVAAHRDRQARIQLRVLSGVQEDRIERHAMWFVAWTTRLYRLLIELEW